MLRVIAKELRPAWGAYLREVARELERLRARVAELERAGKARDSEGKEFSKI